MDGPNPTVVLHYATPIGHGDAPPAGSRLSLQRVEGGVCIVDPPRGRLAAIPGLMGIAAIEFVLLLLLADVVREGMRHGIPMGGLISGISLLTILIGGLIWQAKIVWRGVQLPKTVEVVDGFLRLTNDPDLFGRHRWPVEQVRQVYAARLGAGIGVLRPMRILYDVNIVYRGFQFQRRALRYLSRAEALWAANLLNRAMNLPEIRPLRRMFGFN